MKKKEIYKTDNIWCKVNMETGETEEMRAKMPLHSVSDFFIAYLGAWKDFKPTEGMKMKVFIHCIMVSVRSNPLDEFDGNVFKVQRAVNSVMKELEEINKERERDGKDKKSISEASIRMSISRLAKDGFIIPTDVRGEYYINPKYGIKGSVRQNTYCKLTLASETGKKVLTKRENTDIGK